MRPETRLQRDILKNLRGRGYKVAHVPNGATLSGGPAERARQMANLKHDGLMVGFPDLIVFADSGRCGFIEVKCEGAKQSDHQKTVQGWLDAWGHKYAVCRSIDDVAETLGNWGWLKPPVMHSFTARGPINSSGDSPGTVQGETARAEVCTSRPSLIDNAMKERRT